jgi:2-C-methyl-D-erythritol 4-phosphate cytidylyltransferase
LILTSPLSSPPPPLSDVSFSAIITAGGVGSRFDGDRKKQFFKINGKPIIFFAIEIFYTIAQITEIIVVLPTDEFDVMSSAILSNYTNRVKCVVGGQTRQISVFNGLCATDSVCKFVIIHDGVRPFLDKADLISMMSAVIEKKIVIAASPVKNTLKKVYQNTIVETVPRENLIEVYTPQLFDRQTILSHHEKARTLDRDFTDDAGICEFFGETVYWFETTSPRLKITTIDDIVMAEFMIDRGNLFKKWG